MALMAVALAVLGIIVGVVLCGFLIFAAWLAHRHSQYAHIPGPPRDSFFFGNIPSIRFGTIQEKRAYILVLYNWIQEYGPVTLIWAMHRPMVLISDPQIVRELILTKNLPKSKALYRNIGYLFGERYMGHGLVTETNHSIWERKRKTMNPAFHRSYLKSLMSQFNESADIYLDKLSTLADGKTVVNMNIEFYRVALDVIAKVAFGLNLNSIHDPNAQFTLANNQILDGLVQANRNPFWRFDPRMVPYRNKVTDAINLIRSTGKQCIQERQRQFANGEEMPNDIISMIVKESAKDKDTDIEDLVDEFATFFLAGQETTANTLSFMLMELIHRPDLEERLLTEVKEVLGSREFVTYEDLGKLQFLGQLFKETLRMYPPASGVIRENPERMNVGGYDIPAGTVLQMNIFSTQRNPKYWPDPDNFSPDRWDPAVKDEGGIHIHISPFQCWQIRSNFSWIPFMLGPRNCIGQFFAQFEVKVMMARFFQQFKAEKIPGYKATLGQLGTLRPKEGVPVTLTKR